MDKCDASGIFNLTRAWMELADRFRLTRTEAWHPTKLKKLMEIVKLDEYEGTDVARKLYIQGFEHMEAAYNGH